MKGIDPKYIMWLGLLVTIEQAIGHGTVSLTNVIPVAWAPYVTSWCNLLAFIGTLVMTYQASVSGPQTGPLIGSLPTPSNVVSIDANKAVKLLLIAFLPLAVLASGGKAEAAQLKPLQLTGNIDADNKANFGVGASAVGGLLAPDALIKKIISLTPADLTYAAAMATAANTNAATVRLGCVKAIQALNAQASGVNLKNADGTPMVMPSEPHIFTDLETIAEGIDSLSPTGPLYTSCAGAAALAQTNVLAFINAVVSGTAAAALVVPK
jgi:hypothetical protein